MRPLLERVPMVCVVVDDKTPDSTETADVTNDAAAARANADAAIRDQFDLLKKSEGALTVIGGLMAQASVDGVYPPDAQLAAHRVHEIRRGSLSKSLTKSDVAQISKLSNFATIGLAWNRRGIKLVKELVKRSEGLPKRYHIVQAVLVRLKKRRQGTMPPISELVTMLKEAPAPIPRKTSKTAGASISVKTGDIVPLLDNLIDDANTPTDIRAACEAIKNFAASKVTEVTPGVSDVPGASDG